MLKGKKIKNPLQGKKRQSNCFSRHLNDAKREQMKGGVKSRKKEGREEVAP